jgi:type IV fimbrial biogenesis protein FimT
VVLPKLPAVYSELPRLPQRSVASIAGRRAAGFTLIELMVTVAVAAVLLAVSAPSLRQMMVRNAVAGASQEFSGAFAQARALAVANNACTTICTATVTATGSPSCAAPDGGGFQSGWIVFVNRACDATQTDPTAAGAQLALARNGGNARVSILASDSTLYRVMFDPRGISTATTSGRYQVAASDDSANAHTRTICVDAAGRATVRRYSTTCN